jgi:hypothetical protein
MVYRTYREALDERSPIASWKEKCILRVTLKSGVEFYRTYEFDSTRDKCKRCRHARPGRHDGRLPSSGHACSACGNPYAGFVRQMRTKRSGEWKTNVGAWTDSGRLH